MRLLLLVAFTTSLVLGAPRSKSWENLGQLSAGTPVEVVTDDKSVKGEYVSSSTESLVIRSGAAEQRIPRQSVIRVVSFGRSHRLRNALIGAGAGLVAGIVADQSIGTYFRNESNPTGLRPLLYAIPIGIGTGIGALIPGHPVVFRK